MNIYEYIRGWPTKWSDPTGMQGFSDPPYMPEDDPAHQLGMQLMWHWVFGNNETFTAHADGLKSQENIRIAVRNELSVLNINLCKTGKEQSGRVVIVIKPQPDDWILIHTTNVPSGGLTMDIQYSVEFSKCWCRADFDVSYRWLDLADPHPDRYNFPDWFMAHFPADGEFWIDIRWKDKNTMIQPLPGGGCAWSEYGWPSRTGR